MSPSVPSISSRTHMQCFLCSISPPHTCLTRIQSAVMKVNASEKRNMQANWILHKKSFIRTHTMRYIFWFIQSTVRTRPLRPKYNGRYIYIYPWAVKEPMFFPRVARALWAKLVRVEEELYSAALLLKQYNFDDESFSSTLASLVHNARTTKWPETRHRFFYSSRIDIYMYNSVTNVFDLMVERSIHKTKSQPKRL